MKHPFPDGMPLTVQAVNLPSDTPAIRIDKLTGIVLSLRLGASTCDTATTLVDLLDDQLITAVCKPWGINATPKQVREDPIWALGPLSRAFVTPRIIPPQLVHQHA